MARTFLVSCRNMHKLKYVLNLPLQRMSSQVFAAASRQRPNVDAVRFAALLQKFWDPSISQSVQFSYCITSKTRRTFTPIDGSTACLRTVFTSQTLYTHDDPNKPGHMPVTGTGDNDISTDSDDDTVSSDRTENKYQASHLDDVPAYNKPLSETDVDKEMLRYDYEEFELMPDDQVGVEPTEESIPVELKRGVTGVFDVEEVIELLRGENAYDICVVRVPEELKYVNYLVIVTGRSTRHIRAMAAYLKWTYKRKRSSSDPQSVKIEGELTKDWFAVDLGNIAVHMFLEDARRMYDLETLWTVGSEHDDLSRDLIDDITTSVTRESFSFDAELERLRKLRGYGDMQSATMESDSNWHQQ